MSEARLTAVQCDEVEKAMRRCCFPTAGFARAGKVIAKRMVTTSLQGSKE
jgi:hypothetical protein